MSAPTTEAVQSWRDDVRDLFGVRWGTIAEWIIAGFLSAWLWTDWISSDQFGFPKVGPFRWLIEILDGLSISPPRWLMSFAGWMIEPGRTSLLPLLVAITVVFATFSARGGNTSGLKILAMASVAISLEIDQSAWPLAWVIAVAAIPAAIAMAFAVYRLRNPDPEADEFFWPERVVFEYIFSVVGVFLLPIVAPVFLAVGLVTSYKVRVRTHPSRELTHEVLRKLKEDPKSLSEIDAQTALAAFAAIASSMPDRHASREVARYYLFDIKRAIGAKAMRFRPPNVRLASEIRRTSSSAQKNFEGQG